MSAKSSKGLEIYISKGTATGTSVVPTAITSAKPAVVTVADTTGLTNGDLVMMAGTGFSELDGQLFVVSGLTATEFALQGSDTTGSTATLGTTPSAKAFTAADLQKCCLASISVEAGEPSTISTATYCDPTSSVASSVVEAGTLSFSGFVDVTSADYQELLAAADDGVERYLRVNLPNNGYLVAPVTITNITWDLPIDGAIGFSGSGVLGSKVRHRY